MNTASKFPCLDLTFAKDGGQSFLLDASFRLDDSKVANRKLIVEPPRGRSFRAMCILMLLAKYRGESFADEHGNISFIASVDGPTWIKTLGTSFTKVAQQEFFRNYFQDCKFLSASRGSEHNSKNKEKGGGIGPSAKYHIPQLELQNLHFYKSSRSSDKRTTMTEDELASFAEKLEKDEIGMADGWVPIVPELIARTKEDRPMRLKTSREIFLPLSAQQQLPFLISEKPEKLFDAVRCRIDDVPGRGDWCVTCLNISVMNLWKDNFYDAVTRCGSTIRFAHWSEYSLGEPHTVFGLHLKDRQKEVTDWMKDLPGDFASGGTRKGSMEFYECLHRLPCTTILFVPASSEPPSPGTNKAPDGTWCLLNYHWLYVSSKDTRYGLYLNCPSPLLDLYYNSIVRLFEVSHLNRALVPIVDFPPRPDRY